MDKQNYRSTLIQLCYLCFCQACTWEGIFKIYLCQFITLIFPSEIYSVFHKVQECWEMEMCSLLHEVPLQQLKPNS